jgi:hypothetical protein
VLEEFPRRDAHDARLDALRAQALERLDAERDFRAGRHQDHFGLASRVGEDVRAELDALGAGVLLPVERGERLSAEDEHGRLVPELHDDAPRLGHFVGVRRSQHD